jgi:hypothetical protein
MSLITVTGESVEYSDCHVNISIFKVAYDDFFRRICIIQRRVYTESGTQFARDGSSLNRQADLLCIPLLPCLITSSQAFGVCQQAKGPDNWLRIPTVNLKRTWRLRRPPRFPMKKALLGSIISSISLLVTL